MQSSSCQFWNNKLIPLQTLYPSSVSWKITPLYFLSSNYIYFAQKEPVKVKFFDTFECSGQNLSNSFCQFWNDKSIPLQILYPFSVSWKIAPLYFLSWNNIYFAQKELIKVNLFDTFECSGQNFSNSLCQFWNEKSIPLQILHPSWISWKITPLYFSAQIIYTLLKRRPLKWKFLRLSIAQVKIFQIPCVNFETTSLFLSKFLHPSSVSWKITPLYLFSSNNIYFAQKEPVKVKFFETFECSGQNLSNSFCQFWNNKSIPLQILYPFSVSWKITCLYFLS